MDWGKEGYLVVGQEWKEIRLVGFLVINFYFLFIFDFGVRIKGVFCGFEYFCFCFVD